MNIPAKNAFYWFQNNEDDCPTIIFITKSGSVIEYLPTDEVEFNPELYEGGEWIKVEWPYD